MGIIYYRYDDKYKTHVYIYRDVYVHSIGIYVCIYTHDMDRVYLLV